VPDATERDHHSIKPLHVTCSHKRPECDGSRLHEVSNEETKAVPDDPDCEACAKPPRTAASRKNHDSKVNECLEEVKKPKLWNEQRGYRQSYQEKRGSNWNPHARRQRPIHRATVHSLQYGRAADSVPQPDAVPPGGLSGPSL